MKNLYLLVILQLFVLNCFTQESFLIKGKIESDSSFVNYIAIKLFQNNIQIQAMTSNELGYFEFNNLAKGIYEIRVISMFYEEKIIEIDLLEDFDLGVIQLLESPILLSEVEIKSKVEPVVPTPNGVILNVSDSKLKDWGNALSLLNFAPVTFINTNNVQFENGGLEILVNGKPLNIPIDQQDKFLQSISSQNIEKIEIVDKPDASVGGNKYGSINIILKNDKGISANLESSLMWHNTIFQSYNASIFFNSTKLRIYSIFNLDARNLIFETNGFEKRNNLQINSISRDSINASTPNVLIGVDYQLNSKSSLGLSYAFYYEWMHNCKTITNYNFIANYLLNDSIIDSNTEYNSKYISNIFTINYSLKTDTLGSKFLSTISYAAGFSDRYIFNNFAFWQSSQETIPVHTINYKYNMYRQNNILSGETKYLHFFKNLSSLDFGSKLSYTDFLNGWEAYKLISNKYTFDENNSSDLIFDEYIISLYAGYKLKHKKSNFSISLRGEYNYNNYKNNNENYSQTDSYAILPTFLHNININNKNKIYYYFTQKVYRPQFMYYVESTMYNPITQSYGNSELKPQFQYIFALGYVLNNKYSVALQAIRNTNSFISLPELSNDILIYKFLNGGITNSIGSVLNIPLNIFEWWEMNTSCSGHFVNINYTDNSHSYSSSGFQWHFSNSNCFDLSKQCYLFIDYNYISNSKSFFKETFGYHDLGAGFGYKYKDNLRISFSVFDILNSNITRKKYNYFNIVWGESNYQQISSRTFKIGIVYDFSFGKEIENYKTDKSILEDIKNRVQ